MFRSYLFEPLFYTFLFLYEFYVVVDDVADADA